MAGTRCANDNARGGCAGVGNVASGERAFYFLERRVLRLAGRFLVVFFFIAVALPEV